MLLPGPWKTWWYLVAEKRIPCTVWEGILRLDHSDGRRLDSGKAVILDQMPKTHKNWNGNWHWRCSRIKSIGRNQTISDFANSK